MRYLRTPNQFQLRLGWLSVIAQIVGDKRISREELGRSLLELGTSEKEGEEVQELWLSMAGIERSPQGRISPRAEPDIVRMAITYGIYDPDAQALTDLGQVLYTVDGAQKPKDSPFAWTSARRFIGLRLLLGADGDMALALLKQWPRDGQLRKEQAPELVSNCLKLLATQVRDANETDHLLQQAHRVLQSDRAFSQDIYPRVEPLRELGYLSPGERTGDYYWTPIGRQLTEALLDVNSADELLESGLSRTFLKAEGIKPGSAADASDLQKALLKLPRRLRGAAAEAPLEPVVLITQWRILHQGQAKWIDLRYARQLLSDLTRTTGGNIGLKAGTSVLEQNITWTKDANLKDESLWMSPILVDSTASSPIAPNTAEHGTIESPSALSPVEVSVLPMSSSTPEYEVPSAAPVITAGGPLASEDRSMAELKTPEPASLPSANVSVSEYPPTLENEASSQASGINTGVPSVLLEGSISPPATSPTPLIERHELLWLQYVARILASPNSGAVASTRWGGPDSWIDTLRRHAELPEGILSNKRDPSKSHLLPKGCDQRQYGRYVLGTSSLHTWLDEVGNIPGKEPFERCRDLWIDLQVDVQMLRGALLRAESASSRLNGSIRDRIQAFIADKGPKIDWHQWGAVCEATRGLIDDTIERGLWRRQELWNLLIQSLEQTSRESPALQLLQELVVRRDGSAYTYTQEFIVPARLGVALEQLDPNERLIELDGAKIDLSQLTKAEDIPDGSICLSAAVEMKARTQSQAYARGEEYAREALSRLSFLSTLLAEPATTSSLGEIQERSGRLATEQGVPLKLQEPKVAAPINLVLPDTFGLRRAANNSDMSGVRKAMKSLPALASVDRGALVDARTRLARALHWLDMADEPGLRPKERLSHGWVAFEHLVTEGREQKGLAVMEVAPSVVALCHFKAMVGSIWREALAGLHASACTSPKDSSLHEHARRCLTEAHERWYSSRAAALVPLPEDLCISVSDREAMRALVGVHTTLPQLADAIEAQAPFAAWRLRWLSGLFRSAKDFAKALDELKLEVTSLLMRVYEIRNQLVHEASTFGFDDAYRLEDLYARYRVLINPVVAEIMRLADGNLLGAPLSHAWGLLRARFDELLTLNKNKKSGPVETEHLFSCLEG